MSDLVRVAEAPHEGLIVCMAHHKEVAFELAFEPLPDAPFWGDRCSMCGTVPVTGRRCATVSCRRALHPKWPAIYCCSRCALEDV